MKSPAIGPARGRAPGARRVSRSEGRSAAPAAPGIAALASALVALTAATACAPALKEAPPLVDLAGGGPPPPASAVNAMQRQAADAFATRTLEGARRAAALFLRAASAGPEAAGRADSLLDAIKVEVWIADHDGAAPARQEAAQRAVQAAQWCPSLAPGRPECDYWMGAALGVQARERPSTGLSALPRIEAAFQKAATADPSIDEAGPDRALALLYVRAPGWPTGPGDPQRGLEHARKAVALRPDYPPNRLALAEALAATGDESAGRAEARTALSLAEGRAASGDPDAPEWIEDARKTTQGPGGDPGHHQDS